MSDQKPMMQPGAQPPTPHHPCEKTQDCISPRDHEGDCYVPNVLRVIRTPQPEHFWASGADGFVCRKCAGHASDGAVLDSACSA